MALIPCRECGKNISDTTDECIHCGMKTNLTPDELIREHKSNKSNEINPSDLINEFKIHHRLRKSNESDTKKNISEIVASGFRPLLESIFIILLAGGSMFIALDKEYGTWEKIQFIVIYCAILILIFGLTFLIINTSKKIDEINMTLEDILNQMK